MPARRLSVADYHKPGEAGILCPGERTELLDGWVVEKMSQDPPHAVLASLIMRLIASRLPTDWCVRCQAPVTLDGSEPEPDVVYGFANRAYSTRAKRRSYSTAGSLIK